jgi:hypothetical protein
VRRWCGTIVEVRAGPDVFRGESAGVRETLRQPAEADQVSGPSSARAKAKHFWSTVSSRSPSSTGSWGDIIDSDKELTTDVIVPEVLEGDRLSIECAPPSLRGRHSRAHHHPAATLGLWPTGAIPAAEYRRTSPRFAGFAVDHGLARLAWEPDDGSPRARTETANACEHANSWADLGG